MAKKDIIKEEKIEEPKVVIKEVYKLKPIQVEAMARFKAIVHEQNIGSNAVTLEDLNAICAIF